MCINCKRKSKELWCSMKCKEEFLDKNYSPYQLIQVLKKKRARPQFSDKLSKALGEHGVVSYINNGKICKSCGTPLGKDGKHIDKQMEFKCDYANNRI